MRRIGLLSLLFLLLVGTAARAQQSASYRLEEHVFNSGGQAGAALASASYRISLGSIGEGLAGAPPASASYEAAGGFVAPYPPPGEVLGLALPSPATLTWAPERSAGSYNIYRDLLAGLPSLTYGACDQQGLPATSAVVGASPPARAGYFYLVTVENRLGEEGTKGSRSSGVERTGTMCP